MPPFRWSSSYRWSRHFSSSVHSMTRRETSTNASPPVLSTLRSNAWVQSSVAASSMPSRVPPPSIALASTGHMTRNERSSASPLRSHSSECVPGAPRNLSTRAATRSAIHSLTSSRTSAFSSRRLRMSKLCASTRRCAFSMERVTMRCSMTSPSCTPSRVIRAAMRSPPKRRMRSSSSERKKRDEPGAAAQLAVDAPRLVALGAQDVEPAQARHVGAELDVGAAPGHVGRDRHHAALARLGHDLGFALFLCCVEHRVLDALALEHVGEQLAHLDVHRAHEHGLAALVALDDLVDDGGVLLALGTEDDVVLVRAHDVLVGRDHGDVELVDLPELARLRLGRAVHARQLVVEAEEVLQRDRGQGLGLALDLHALLGLDGLVQAVGVAPARHEAPRELVHDEHLAVLHHVLHVLVVERVRLEELEHVVDALVALRVVGVQALALLHAALGRRRLGAFEQCQLLGEVGQHERTRVLGREMVAPLLEQVHVVLLLLHRVVEVLVHLVHALVAEELELDFGDELGELRLLREQTHEALVLGSGALDLEKVHARVPLLFLGLFGGRELFLGLA